MRTSISATLAAVLLTMGSAARADTAWSTQDYDLHPGDFNGDGLTDMLYVARDPAHLSGIALSDGSGFNTPLQSWGNAYLGIPWSDGLYTTLVADFNGDGKDDLFLQRNTPGDHYLLLTEEGGIGAISQTVPNDAAGLDWSGKAHYLVAGDFNGDGRSDLFLQASDADGLNAVLTVDADGQFTATVPDQSWDDGYAGFDWATSEALVFAGDYNGDGQDDLLLQARPMAGTGTDALNPAVFMPNLNGVVLAQPAKAIFATEGVQAWSRDGFKAEWSPLISALSVGDFNGDGRADVLLQGQTASDTSYLLYGKAKGAIFEPATTLEAGELPAAESYQLLPGAYSGKAEGLYAQARSPTGSNFLAVLSSSKLITTLADAPLAFDSGGSASQALAPAASESGGTGPLALVTPNTPGRTPGQFAVSPMGAATYQIPIWTPPGARGLEPKLALVYTSGSPDGVMGPGWNLAGLSAIARCNKTYADNNGAPAPVTLTTGNSGDDFCLDGNRMRMTSGTDYGAAGTVYQTEIANFSRITAYGAAGNGPSYFYMEGKDGLIYEYGNTADSKVYANGGSTPYAWMLNKVRDRQTQANNLKIVYSATSGAVQPSSIQYTQTPSTNGSTYPYTVSFTYQDRQTTLSKFVAGGAVQQTKILNKIGVTSSGVSVRQYNMTYSTAGTTQRDRLTSIQECGGSAGSDCLRATSIIYQDGSSGVASSGTTVLSSGSTLVTSADINGDGLVDLVYRATTSPYHVFVKFAGSSGTYGSAVDTGLVYTASATVLFGAFLGKGQIDILSSQGGTWNATRWTGSAFSTVTTGVSVDALSSNALADTDGDGLPDLVTLRTDGWIYIRRNTSTGTSPSLAAPSQAFNFGYSPASGTAAVYADYANSSGLRTVDFDGDGRQDVVVWRAAYSQHGTDAYTLLRGTGATLTSYAVYPIEVGPLSVGNFNDDQCTDYVITDVAYFSGCNGSTTTASLTGSETIAAVLDWDGDGRTDLLIYLGARLPTYNVRLSRGNGFAAGASTGILADVSTPLGAVTDVNGDGLADLLLTTSGSVSQRVHNGALAPADLATSITDGWGVAASPTYVPITQNNYTPGTGAVFPEMDFQGAAYVVSQATQTDGIGGSFSNTFQYTGARIHRQGRGFEGFAKTRTVDLRNRACLKFCVLGHTMGEIYGYGQEADGQPDQPGGVG